MLDLNLVTLDNCLDEQRKRTQSYHVLNEQRKRTQSYHVLD